MKRRPTSVSSEDLPHYDRAPALVREMREWMSHDNRRAGAERVRSWLIESYGVDRRPGEPPKPLRSRRESGSAQALGSAQVPRTQVPSGAQVPRTQVPSGAQVPQFAHRREVDASLGEQSCSDHHEYDDDQQRGQ